MNGKRAKIIKKLVKDKFPTLYFMIRNQYGDETKDMNEQQIYRIAKKMWNKKISGTEKWVYKKRRK